MFDYSLLHWGTFLTAAALLNLAPGPDIAFILGQTVRGGPRSGFAALAGVWTGVFGHVLMAAAGLAAVLAASATVFLVVKWVGAAYLIWLGIAALRSDGSGFISDGTKMSPKFTRIYRQGLIVALMNPKLAMFWRSYHSLWRLAPVRSGHNCFCMVA